MNWMTKLYETYEASLKIDGISAWPLSHFEKNAHVEVVLDQFGNLKSGRMCALSGEQALTLIPATEASSGRTGSKIAPHPLCEELSYCASDIPNDGQEKNRAYMAQLMRWSESEFSHPKVRSILSYLLKGTLFSDISREIELPLTFKSRSGQTTQIPGPKVFVRWRVETPGEPCSGTWDDADLIEKWIGFDEKENRIEGYCHVKGEMVRVCRNHPRFVRFLGDGAKLISSNDSDGYTFRGRFLQTEQAAEVGFEVSQKAHSALRWLINQRQQAFRNDTQVIISWAVSSKKIPDNPMLKDLTSLFDEPLELRDEANEKPLQAQVETETNLGQQFAIALKRYMAGYYQDFANTPTESIVIMGLDSATTGRMAITYYRAFMAKEYLDVISQWYSDFAWPQRVVKEYEDSKGKTKSKVRWLPGAPNINAIIRAAYGDIATDSDGGKKLKKNLSMRILPSIIEGQKIPPDFVDKSVRRASNRYVKRLPEKYSTTESELGAWEKDLGVTCGLVRGYMIRNIKRREISMSLDLENRSRDYLYGRLLAVAEAVEEKALQVSGEKIRSTNAGRLMQHFSEKPYSTWPNIENGLRPYFQRLRSRVGGLEAGYKKLLDEIMNLFESEEFMSNERLRGGYLLGFHCQRLWLRDRKIDKGEWILREENEKPDNEAVEQGEE